MHWDVEKKKKQEFISSLLIEKLKSNGYYEFIWGIHKLHDGKMS